MNTVRYQDLPSDRSRVMFMREKLSTDPKWILKGLYTIYLRQTEDEKCTGQTKHSNNVGFTATDSDILTSFVQQMMIRGFAPEQVKQYKTLEVFFSPKQAAIITTRLPKYAKQLVKISKNQL